MNQLEFSNKENFIKRRYAIRLGRRYASAAASVILLGVLGYSKVNNIDSAFAQSLHSLGQQSLATEQAAPETID